MERLLAFGGSTGGDDQKTTEQKIQDEIAGDDVLLKFVIQGQGSSTGEPPFMEEVVSESFYFKICAYSSSRDKHSNG
jgi:hypothetical protein